MTTSEDTGQSSSGPRKRYIGKARAEALRKKAGEQKGPNIEDGILVARGT